MPTLLLVEGFRFYFHSREGTEPPLVHVRKGGANEALATANIARLLGGYSPSELTASSGADL